MQKIVPFLWFNDNAEEAANLYVSIFANSELLELRRYGEAWPSPNAGVSSATFRLAGLQMIALNGGPQFAFTPAVSFFVTCATPDEIDGLWRGLSEGGTVLMDLQEYPFSRRYGWVSDRFGLSWQLNLAGGAQKITPFLTFVGDQNGRAEEAMRFYASLFARAAIDQLEYYGEGLGEPEGALVHGRFRLEGQEFMAMESSGDHHFTFTPAVSFFVNCGTQQEVDTLWETLSEGGGKHECGWLHDRFGVSWQIVPTVLGEYLADADPTRSQRVMQAMLQMTKLQIDGLVRAHEGK